VERDPSRWWYGLLALPFLGLLYPPLYATRDPEIAGVPFFYWYQLAWVPLTALLTYVVYRRTRP
jgi:hypothetical protein